MKNGGTFNNRFPEKEADQMPGKWGLHTFYLRHSVIRRFLPQTAVMTPRSLNDYLAKYRSVYIKPNMEHTGRGIVKAWKTEHGIAYVKVRGKVRRSSGPRALFRRISAGSKQQYIVQQTIDLAKVDGRPFDIRVMMMRDGSGRWRFMGMLAKVAGPGSVITNVLRGRGYVLTVEQALRKSQAVDSSRIESAIRRLVRLSRLICRHFNGYKYSRQIGIDFGIDGKGRIWVIEVNFDFPSHALFAKLPDKTIYRKIKRMAAMQRQAAARKKHK